MSSTVIAKNIQIGADGTASNNFTIFQPASPDGTLRIGNGNTGITASLVTLTSAGAFSVTGTTTTTLSVAGNEISAVNSLGFRNRIINGDMRIDQRNAGASVTVNNLAIFYGVDRFRAIGQASSGVFTMQQVSDGPAGFVKSLKVTVTTADASIAASDRYLVQQVIEGNNAADLAFGSANASAVTISFWVKSSLTGSFGAALQNDVPNRSYPFTYTISAANTWEYKTVTIVGDTTGTWPTDNTGWGRVNWSIGNGSTFTSTAGSWQAANYEGVTGQTQIISTLSATWQITGVQLEAGSVASPFERRDYGRELMMCQRYYVELGPQLGTNAYRAIGFGSTYTTTQGTYVIQVPVPMRIVPSLSQAGTMYLQNLGSTSVSSFAGPYTMGGTIIEGDFTMAGAIASNAIGILRWNNVAGTKSFAYSAEL